MANWIRLPIVLIGLLLLTGCVTLMAPYDDRFDQMTTDLQRKVATHIESLDGAGMPDCLYPAHAAFYGNARVDIGALAVRAEAHELNAQTVAQIGSLKRSIDDLEKLHKLASARPRCLGPDELAPLGRAFDSILGAILKLEFAKKRGAT